MLNAFKFIYQTVIGHERLTVPQTCYTVRKLSVESHACSSCSALDVDVASQSKYSLVFINCQSNKCNYHMMTSYIKGTAWLVNHVPTPWLGHVSAPINQSINQSHILNISPRQEVVLASYSYSVQQKHFTERVHIHYII